MRVGLVAEEEGGKDGSRGQWIGSVGRSCVGGSETDRGGVSMVAGRGRRVGG